MRKKTTARAKCLLPGRILLYAFAILLSVVTLTYTGYSQQTRVKRVLFQGFWWDYWNNNFPNKWSDYLTELSPRLKDIGIDAVWIPPAAKCATTGNVGYGPFDHYDLGDKFQKGGSSVNVRTRMGSKDELLRMVAVMHANGIEVIEDVVLNHVDGAGSNSGAGGKDPEPFSVANAGGFKNFRYVSYSTPYINDSQDDYWTRNGRWAKNYPNFYPNLANNCTTGDICSPFFGPDISYEGTAYGASSNIPLSGSANINGTIRPYVNPIQPFDYVRTNARNWITWFKKQTGVDGWRWDAVKHFPLYIQEDLIYNVKYTISPFAQGGEAMFNVGEWVGSKSEIDAYVMGVRSGNEEHTGSFDLSLRGYGPNGGLYSMVMGQGFYNIQLLPGDQQDKRYYDYATQRVHRTCPFVNSHDTYRPIVDASGNFSKPLGDYTGWNTGNELGGNGQHIDPREPRLFSAYATIFAMDGNPIVFFEDLFDIGTTGKRYSHLPGNVNDLPVRQDIVNIIQAHQKLAYKNGDYGVLTALGGVDAPVYQKGSAADHLVIQRWGRAIIGITDKFAGVNNNSADEEVWVTAGDPSWRNKDLIDYSGAHGLTTTRVFGDGRVLIKTAPVGHSIPGARGHGYSIWAPIPDGITFNTVEEMYGYLDTYNPGRTTSTVQEWEMANDLGDSHPNSLQQGGALPSNSKAVRNVGRIYAIAGKTITARLYPEVNGRRQDIGILAGSTIVASNSGISSNTSPLTVTYTPTTTGWFDIKIRNSTANIPGQKVWVNVTYTAPTNVNTRRAAAPAVTATAFDEVSEDLTSTVAAPTMFVYPNPTSGGITLTIPGIPTTATVQAVLFSNLGAVVYKEKKSLASIRGSINNTMHQLKPGVYFLQVSTGAFNEKIKIVKQ